MKKKILLACMLFINIAFLKTEAQSLEHLELGGWTGASIYSGDMDKSKGIPNLQNSGIGLGLNAKYYVMPKLGIRAGFDFSVLKAADKNSGTYYRMKRNDNFNSNVIDFYIMPEYTVWHGLVMKHDLAANIYAGIGLLDFNTNVYKEGAFVSNSKGIKANFPFGACVKYSLNSQWGVGLEMRINKTTTDQLDGISLSATNGSDVSVKSDWYYYTGITVHYTMGHKAQ